MIEDYVEYPAEHYRELWKLNDSQSEYSENWKRKIAHYLSLLSDSSNGVSLYKITADYRKNNPDKPDYYVLGRSIKEAKQRFRNRITWLKIYGCEVCDSGTAKDIVSNPIHYIVF